MRKAVVAGNWKLFGTQASMQEIDALREKLNAIDNAQTCDVMICPPATIVMSAVDRAKNSVIKIGGQNCHTEQNGAYTGEISAEMLRDAGASHVIVGHSERRTQHQETSDQVRSKAAAAMTAGLVPIICVGEAEAVRDEGQAEQFIVEQICSSMPDGANGENVMVAYEPIWAIGTGRTPTPDDIGIIHKAIRNGLEGVMGEDEVKKLRILYGGSVKGSNAKSLMGVDGVDGALVGGASLKADDFYAIISEAYLA